MRALPAAFVRHVYFPLAQYYKGESLLQRLDNLGRLSQLSTPFLLSQQWQRVQEVVRLSRTAPFWRERLSGLKDPISPEEFSKIPLLEKHDLRGDLERFCNPTVHDYSEVTTSGSTGMAVRVRVSPQHQSSNFACQWFGRSWYGVEIGDPAVWIWGRPIASRYRRFVSTTKARLNNLLLLQIFDLSEEVLADWWREIRRFRPVYLYGYASALDRLADFIESQNARVEFPLKLVSTTAEVLHDFQRARLQRVFRAPVANEYGSTEAGLIAFECPHGGWHLCTDHVYAEFLDPSGKAVAPGELGDIVLTPLHKKAMPLLRYRIGDLGSPSREQCSCGRPWPLMSMGVGKTVEFVKTPSGRLLSGAIFHYINRALLEERISGIHAFRVVQRALDDFLVEYVAEGSAPSQAISFFEKHMRRLIGEPIHVSLQEVAELKPEPSGKLRYFVSQVK